MLAGQTDADAYTAALRWGEPAERSGAAREVAAAVAAELDAAHPSIDWRATAARISDGA
jgi:hypothetical protein